MKTTINKSLIASSNVRIYSTSEKLWDVLTNPEKIKIYLFNTNVKTSWIEGSPIIFQGEYQGIEYIDKGNVLKFIPDQLLKYNYWSSFSGLEDEIENYSLITYQLEVVDKNSLIFSWHQQGFSNEDGRCHTQDGLDAILQQIKKLAEM